MAFQRRAVYFNPDAQQWHSNPSADLEDAYQFHKSMPGYAQTELISLDDVARELGLGQVYVKHEGNRLGLPSFKILGASWGTYRAVIGAFGLPSNADIPTIRAATASTSTALFAATDGNHGRAVARLARMFGMPAKIFVPANMDANTIAHIRSEAAEVINTGKSYDDAIMEAAKGAHSEKGLLIQDCGFDDYQQLPEWIVDGYSTCLREIDMQLADTTADLVVVPVGVGSLAQAVVTHYRRPGSHTTVMTVEPDTAACLWKSLQKGVGTSIKTTPTIMNGLDCGTVSTTAWSILKAGTGASITVTDHEAHEAVVDYEKQGVRSGPCGAAGLAALRRLTSSDRKALNLGTDSVVVLLNTEAFRPYKIPKDVRVDDVGLLTEQLTNILSNSSSSGKHEAPVETSIAEYVMAWLEHRDIECHWLEAVTGRPSVVGVVRGTGGGKNLMLHANLDVKSTVQKKPSGPDKAKLQDNRVYGHGANDMKGGLAASMIALARLKMLSLQGDVLQGAVILTAVAGGEGADVGIRQVLAAGWHADGAVVPKPTGEFLVTQSRGAVNLEVNVHHASISAETLGADPITQAAYFLVELDKYRRQKPGCPLKLRGGIRSVRLLEPSNSSRSCTVALEWETSPGETAEVVKQAMQDVINVVSQKRPSACFSLRITSTHGPFITPASHPFAQVVLDAISSTSGEAPSLRDDIDWPEGAVLAQAGIIPLAWGPIGGSSGPPEMSEEWVDIKSLGRVVDGLTAIAQIFCA